MPMEATRDDYFNDFLCDVERITNLNDWMPPVKRLLEKYNHTTEDEWLFVQLQTLSEVYPRLLNVLLESECSKYGLNDDADALFDELTAVLDGTAAATHASLDASLNASLNASLEPAHGGNEELGFPPVPVSRAATEATRAEHKRFYANLASQLRQDEIPLPEGKMCESTEEFKRAQALYDKMARVFECILCEPETYHMEPNVHILDDEIEIKAPWDESILELNSEKKRTAREELKRFVADREKNLEQVKELVQVVTGEEDCEYGQIMYVLEMYFTRNLHYFTAIGELELVKDCLARDAEAVEAQEIARAAEAQEVARAAEAHEAALAAEEQETALATRLACEEAATQMFLQQEAARGQGRRGR